MIREEITELKKTQTEMKQKIFNIIKQHTEGGIKLTPEEEAELERIIYWTIIGATDNLDQLRSDTFTEYENKLRGKAKYPTYTEKVRRIFR